MGIIRSTLILKLGQSLFRRFRQSRQAGGASGGAGGTRQTGRRGNPPRRR